MVEIDIEDADGDFWQSLPSGHASGETWIRPFLVDANVNKGSERSRLDDSRQFHTWFRGHHLVDILGETEFLGALARVTAGLGQLLSDIIRSLEGRTHPST